MSSTLHYKFLHDTKSTSSIPKLYVRGIISDTVQVYGVDSLYMRHSWMYDVRDDGNSSHMEHLINTHVHMHKSV